MNDKDEKIKKLEDRLSTEQQRVDILMRQIHDLEMKIMDLFDRARQYRATATKTKN